MIRANTHTFLTSFKLPEGVTLPPLEFDLESLPVPEGLEGIRVGPARPDSYSYVGRVRKLREGMGLPTHAEWPGYVPLAICTDYGDSTVAYFKPDRRPKIGTRIGAHGTWLVVDVDVESEDLASDHPDCPLCQLQDQHGSTAVDFQLEVDRWVVVPDDYDPLLD